MATNELLTFANGEDANVLPTNQWEALTDILENGFQSGIAKSEQVNRVLSQGAIASYVLGQLVVDQLDLDANLNPTTLYQNVVLALQQIGIQTGMVVAFSANSAPKNGFLLCNGAEVSRTTYATLFAAIGVTYGSGDGSTTFNLPNLTDKFIQGSGTAGTVKSAGLPNIKGDIKRSSAAASGAQMFGDLDKTDVANSGAIGLYSTGKSMASIGNGGAYSNVIDAMFFDASKSNAIYGKSSTVQPPSLTMRFYIKY